MIIAVPTSNSGEESEVPKRTQNAAYCKYLFSAGFDPILIPMETNPKVAASIADGLLLAGGVDIDPLYYGTSNIASFSVDPQRDSAERALLHEFRMKKKPVFGICRGFQLIFREFLHTNPEYEDYLEYIENLGNHAQTSNLNVKRSVPTHLVRANTEALFGISVGNNNPMQLVPVNSMHHQVAIVNYMKVAEEYASDKLEKGEISTLEPTILEIEDFELVAWSLRGVTQPKTKGDISIVEENWAIIEALKIHNWGGPIMGVQWHPEELKNTQLIKNFFDPQTKQELITGLS